MVSENNSGKPIRLVPGSLSQQSEPEYLVVGKLRRPHGFKGEILMDVVTDFPERLSKNKKVFIGNSYEIRRIENTRTINNGILILFEGIKDEKEAGKFRNQLVYVASNEIPKLPDGRYYFHQLIGLEVIDENNNHIGLLDEILETGANDVYIVKNQNGEEILLPAIDSVILDINLLQNRMLVRLPIY